MLSRQPSNAGGRDVKPKRLRFDVENARELRKELQSEAQARRNIVPTAATDSKPLRKSLGKSGLDGLCARSARVCADATASTTCPRRRRSGRGHR